MVQLDLFGPSRKGTPMTRDEFGVLLDEIQAEERKVREDGQREYTVNSDSPFYNFDQVGSMIPCPHCGKPVGRYVTLMVYALKHVFGVLSWIGGQKSQREDVRGRIKDARMYLALLRGMVEEKENAKAVLAATAPVGESERVVDIGMEKLVFDVARAAADELAQSARYPVGSCHKLVASGNHFNVYCNREVGHEGPCSHSLHPY